jgi:hypothetical protein
VVELLRNMTNAATVEDFRSALDKFFRYSDKHDPELGKYFHTTWQKTHPPELWCPAFVDHVLVRRHTTNNVCESHNNVLRSFFPNPVRLARGVLRLVEALDVHQHGIEEVQGVTEPQQEDADRVIALRLLDQQLNNRSPPSREQEEEGDEEDEAPRHELSDAAMQQIENFNLRIEERHTLQVDGECFPQAMVDQGETLLHLLISDCFFVNFFPL